MKKLKIGLFGIFSVCTLHWGCNTTKNMTTNGYETVENDPMKVKIHTLKNGLKVYMSVVKDAPRIQTYVVTRAGSKNDPADATGLAHYLEHMLFKGTSEIGALDWKEEKKLLGKISDLYEKHRSAKPEERAAIYKQIDELSSDAAKLVAANEYDKMISALGAKGTNAFTSLDRTAYVNNIPSNELEKWLKIESERFSELVLRLFHTELEAVYEEFNISQNRDGRKVFTAYLEALCPNHPYGTQTTIGTGEHLKTPSMEKIHDFFDTYYVPNNMAIVLAGDFDPDNAVALVEKYWGKYKSKKIPNFKVKEQPNYKEPVIKEVFGKEKARLQAGWRMPGANTDEALLGKLAASILYNNKTGLIDLNLVQRQVIGAESGAGIWSANDFSFFYLYGDPNPGQPLEEVKELLLKEVLKLQQGDFEDWMLEAIVNDLEYKEIQSRERLMGRAYSMMDAFIFDQEWEEATKEFERLRAFTKEDVINFAKKYMDVNGVAVIYKREGEDPNVLKVDKPTITPVQVNRDTMSKFRKEVTQMSSSEQSPVFVDFDKQINTTPLVSGIQLNYIPNTSNETFEMEYIFEMGERQDNALPLAIKYLPFLGTDKYTAEELKQEFFKLGLSFDVYTGSEVSYVILRGLDRSFEKGVELFEHVLANAKGDEKVLKKMVAQLQKARKDEKKDKNTIMRKAFMNYGIYGRVSPFRTRLRPEQMEYVSTNDLLKRIHRLTSYEHEVFYYGSKTMDAVKNTLDKYHKVPDELRPIPNTGNFRQKDTEKDQVLFVNFEGMAQAEIMLLSKGTPEFDLEQYIMNELYNQYFGAGLSSVVFQEIRESRALAYSAYTFNGSPSDKDKAHYLRAFVGTQSDKIKDAIPALKGIIEDIPISEDQIANAVDAIIKKIESERIIKADIYWTKKAADKRGLNHDIRKDSYEKYQTLAQSKSTAVKALKDFHAKHIKGRKYTYMVLGDKDKIDLEYLQTLGEFKEIPLKDLFGY